MDEIIIRYIDGTANEDEKRRLLDWVEESPDNQQYLSDMQSIWLASMATFGQEQDEEKALELLRLRIKKDKEYQRIKLNSRLFKLGLYVADLVAVLILALGLYLLYEKHSSNETQQQVVLVINKVVMPKGSKGEFVLPDGSVAWINGGSVLSFPEHFAKDKREVRIEGEAYFSVVKNKNCPFIVQTNDLDITVLGTQFDVLNYSSLGCIEATVVSGSVKVKTRHDDKEFVLKPNQKLSFTPNDSLTRVENVNAVYSTNWINNRLVFDNDKLGDIFVSLERWYNIKVNCSDVNLQGIRITFTIRNESKEEILKIIKRIAPINYRIHDNEINITSTI